MRGNKDAQSGRVKELDKYAFISIAAVIFWALYGYFRGGDSIQMRLQIHTHVITMMSCVTFAGIYRTPEDFFTAGRIIIWAALWRAFMELLFTILFRGVVVEAVLDHGDSLLFTTAFTIAAAHGIHTKKRGTTLRCVLVMVTMLWAIQTNNRRLAWVSLVCSMLILYFLSTATSARKRLHGAIKIVVPILALYVGVGLNSNATIFKPLKSFQQIGGSEKEDLSTISRNIENLGLAETLRNYPLMGTGFGHEYIEVSDALAPKESFPMYRYDPHNSVVGLAAFMGLFGFFFVWLIFPMIAYYAARAYRFATTSVERTVAVVAVCEIIIHTNQMFGDIGINASEALVLLPLAFAAASRLVVSTGGMGGGSAAGASGQNRAVGTVNVTAP
jgi:hypothetical protein